MIYSVKQWMTVDGVKLLRDVGIERGQIVLDFGCGTGYYAIPAAIIVGKHGKIYALDKDKNAIDELLNTSRMLGLSNIVSIKTSGELKLNLKSNIFDAVLLYDVLHHYYFNRNGRRELLKEVYRVSRGNALLSVFPKHMDLQEIIEEIENVGFHFKNKLFKKLIHYYNYEEGHILNFYK